MKEIICSDSTTLALQNLQKILEVLFGRTTIACWTFYRGGTLFEIKAKAKISYPQPMEVEIIAQLFMTERGGTLAFDSEFTSELYVEPRSKNEKVYYVRYLPENDLFQLNERSQSIVMDPDTVFFVGNSAENRWTEPCFEGQIKGLCYDI